MRGSRSITVTSIRKRLPVIRAALYGQFASPDLDAKVFAEIAYELDTYAKLLQRNQVPFCSTDTAGKFADRRQAYSDQPKVTRSTTRTRDRKTVRAIPKPKR